MGIIDSLSGGFRLLGRHVELLLIPLLLDVWLWFAPRLSIAPLFARVSAFYERSTSVEGMPPDLAEMSSQVPVMLAAMGESSNIWAMMVNSSVLHVPSLLAAIPPVGESSIVALANPLLAALLMFGLSVAGIVFGVFYLHLLVQRLPLNQEGASAPSFRVHPRRFVERATRDTLKVLFFIVLTLAAILAITIPVSMGIGLIALISPALTSVLAVVLGGLSLVFFFYLYFVVVGMIADDLSIRQAVVQSVSLVRAQFWATLGFIIVTSLISVGFSLIFGRLAAAAPIGTLISLLANAYIGTGLTMALLVFYRTRLMSTDEQALFLDPGS